MDHSDTLIKKSREHRKKRVWGRDEEKNASDVKIIVRHFLFQQKLNGWKAKKKEVSFDWSARTSGYFQNFTFMQILYNKIIYTINVENPRRCSIILSILWNDWIPVHEAVSCCIFDKLEQCLHYRFAVRLLIFSVHLNDASRKSDPNELLRARNTAAKQYTSAIHFRHSKMTGSTSGKTYSCPNNRER